MTCSAWSPETHVAQHLCGTSSCSLAKVQRIGTTANTLESHARRRPLSRFKRALLSAMALIIEAIQLSEVQQVVPRRRNNLTNINPVHGKSSISAAWVGWWADDPDDGS